MRIHFKAAAVPTRAAKRLKKLLDLPESTAREWTAYVFGYRNWQELLAHLGSAPQSQLDDDCRPEEVTARRCYQVQRLGECLAAERKRVKPVDAAQTVETWKPSGAPALSLLGLKLKVPRKIVERTALQLLGLEALTPVSALPAELLATAPPVLKDKLHKDVTHTARTLMRRRDAIELAWARQVLEYLHARGNLTATTELARSLALGAGGPADTARARALYGEVLSAQHAGPPLKLVAKDGVAALDGGREGWPSDVPGALTRWEEKALSGSAEDAYRTALTCDPYKPLSREAPPNPEKAARFYRMAAHQDYRPAAAGLATLLSFRPELAEHFTESEYWRELAAMEGDAACQTITSLVEDNSERLFERLGDLVTEHDYAALLSMIPEKERGDVRILPGLGEMVAIPPRYLVQLSTGYLYSEKDGRVERQGTDRLAMEIVAGYPRDGSPLDKAGWVSQQAEILGRFLRYFATRTA